MIGAHDVDGFLAVGIHTATWEEVVERFGFNKRRALMLERLHMALVHFADAGCQRAYLAGSFVSTKPEPGDLDVAWDVAGVDVEMVHPMFLDLSAEARNDVFWAFAGDYFPAQGVEAVSGLTFLEFFQRTREGRPVGIVEIDLSTVE